jgi:hypothetical protein
MSEYFFGGERGKLTPKQVKNRETAAKKHGATFVYANIPGDGRRSWFECRNQGSPFNENTERHVLHELEELEPPPEDDSELARFQREIEQRDRGPRWT